MLGIGNAKVAREMFYQNHTDYSQNWKVIVFYERSGLQVTSLCVYHPTLQVLVLFFSPPPQR